MTPRITVGRFKDRRTGTDTTTPTTVVRTPSGLTWTPQPLLANTPYTLTWNAVTTATAYRLEERIGFGAREHFQILGYADGIIVGSAPVALEPTYAHLAHGPTHHRVEGV